jgi:hypothetical protein
MVVQSGSRGFRDLCHRCRANRFCSFSRTLGVHRLSCLRSSDIGGGIGWYTAFFPHLRGDSSRMAQTLTYRYGRCGVTLHRAFSGRQSGIRLVLKARTKLARAPRTRGSARREIRNFAGATPGQREARSAVAIIVNDDAAIAQTIGLDT